MKNIKINADKLQITEIRENFPEVFNNKNEQAWTDLKDNNAINGTGMYKKEDDNSTNRIVLNEREIKYFPITWHHIIDLHKIREIWTQVTGDLGNIRNRELVKAWIESTGFTKNIIIGNDQNTENAIWVEVDDNSQADEEGLSTEIRQEITWSLWNLVQGPGKLGKGYQGVVDLVISVGEKDVPANEMRIDDPLSLDTEKYDNFYDDLLDKENDWKSKRLKHVKELYRLFIKSTLDHTELIETFEKIKLDNGPNNDNLILFPDDKIWELVPKRVITKRVKEINTTTWDHNFWTYVFQSWKRKNTTILESTTNTNSIKARFKLYSKYIDVLAHKAIVYVVEKPKEVVSTNKEDKEDTADYSGVSDLFGD